MTYIQPIKRNILSRVIFWLIAIGVFGALALVLIYNQTVNLEHNIAEVRDGIKQAQGKNVELQELIFAILNSDNFAKTVGNGFIVDKNPEYLPVEEKWSFASQH